MDSHRVNGKFAKRVPASPAPAASTPAGALTSGGTIPPDPPVSQIPTSSQTPPTPTQVLGESGKPPTRGRKPFPRDAAGNILRPSGTAPQSPPGHISGDQLVRPGGSVVDRFQHTGAALAGMLVGACVMGISDEWIAKPEEMDELTKSFTAYCRAKNFPDLPPGIVLLGSLAMYALPRLRMPKTEQKLASLVGRFGGAKNRERNSPNPIQS